jgi:[ribosomal protein S5]-alanine N-acetyltransferase
MRNTFKINDTIFEQDNFPVLTTERLILKKLDLSEKEELFRLRSDIKTAEEMCVSLFKQIEDAEEMIINSNYSYEFKMGINWSIYLKKDFKFIGDAGIWRIDREHFRGEIGYSLLPEFRKCGFMTETLTAILKTAFSKINLHSIEANVDPQNNNSIQLLKKMGFIQEGYLKENYYLDGKFYDTILFSRLAEPPKGNNIYPDDYKN